jgi:predicted amidohydrolase
MDWTAAATEWKAFRNEVRARWQHLSDSQLDAIGGMRIRLAEHIRASYGVTPDEAERQICNFEARNQYLRVVSSR